MPVPGFSWVVSLSFLITKGCHFSIFQYCYLNYWMLDLGRIIDFIWTSSYWWVLNCNSSANMFKALDFLLDTYPPPHTHKILLRIFWMLMNILNPISWPKMSMESWLRIFHLITIVLFSRWESETRKAPKAKVKGARVRAEGSWCSVQVFWLQSIFCSFSFHTATAPGSRINGLVLTWELEAACFMIWNLAQVPCPWWTRD